MRKLTKKEIALIEEEISKIDVDEEMFCEEDNVVYKFPYGKDVYDYEPDERAYQSGKLWHLIVDDDCSTVYDYVNLPNGERLDIDLSEKEMEEDRELVLDYLEKEIDKLGYKLVTE